MDTALHPAGPHTLLVEISPDGTVTVTVEGVHGPSCEGVARRFAEDLGGKIVEVGPTGDRWRARVQVTARQRLTRNGTS